MIKSTGLLYQSGTCRCISGQDTSAICQAGALSVSELCQEQVLFLYQHENVNNDIPCYAECEPCYSCLLQVNADRHLAELNATLWESVFPGYFGDVETNDTDSSEDDSDSGEDNVTDVTRECHIRGEACMVETIESMPIHVIYARIVQGDVWGTEGVSNIMRSRTQQKVSEHTR